MTNHEWLQRLLAQGAIALSPAARLDSAPPTFPASFDFDRVEGMLLGLAIGDALGVTTEGLLPTERRRRFGEVRNYLPNRRCLPPPGQPARGCPSDDTQLAFWTLEQLRADRGFVPEHVAQRFCRDRIFGIGQAVGAAVARLRAGTE